MRLFKLNKKYRDVDEKSRAFKAVEIYNRTIHSTTKLKPFDLLKGNLSNIEWNALKERIHRQKIIRINKLNETRKEPSKFRNRELVKNLGFHNLKHLPKYITKEVKDKRKTYFIDEKGQKRDRHIIKRKYKFQDPLNKNALFDRKLTGRNRSKNSCRLFFIPLCP